MFASQGLTAIGVPDARQLLVSLPWATTFTLSAHASRTYVPGRVVAGMATETDPDESAVGPRAGLVRPLRLRLQRGCGVRAWGPDGLGTGGREGA